MKKVTRIVVIAITLLMALSLVGCSKGGDTGTDTGTFASFSTGKRSDLFFYFP